MGNPVEGERDSALKANTAEHHSGRRAKLFAFPPERCSPSERNAVRIHNGIVFAFRAESRSPSTGFPNLPQSSVVATKPTPGETSEATRGDSLIVRPPG